MVFWLGGYVLRDYIQVIISFASACLIMTLLIQGQKGRKYRRITITLDQRIENKIKELQIKKENQIKRSVSFSKILNQVLMDALKNGEFVEGEFLEKI